MSGSEAIAMRDEQQMTKREEALAREQRALEALGEENARLNREIDSKKRTDPRDDNGDSKYARKRKFCAANGVWGFEVPEPKPWKGGA